MTAQIIPLKRAIRQRAHYQPAPLDPARMARFTPPLTARTRMADAWRSAAPWLNDAAKAAALIAIVLPFLLVL